jgi:hypothetical protein
MSNENYTSSNCLSSVAGVYTVIKCGVDCEPQFKQKFKRKSFWHNANPGNCELGTVILDKIGDGFDIAFLQIKYNIIKPFNKFLNNI